MADYAHRWEHTSPDPGTVASGGNRTYAEDAALVLSLVIVVMLSATLGAFLLLEFFEILPTSASTVLLATLLIFCAVVGRALLRRVLSVPPEYQAETAVLRHLSRSSRKPAQA